MGNMTLAREDARAVWIFESIERIWRDVRYGIRGLRREPGFTLAATLTLALGVATTTTVFSIIDSELWKSWPLPAVDRLVVVSRHGTDLNGSFDYVSGVDLLAWKKQSRAFESIGAAGRYNRGVTRRRRERRIGQGDAGHVLLLLDDGLASPRGRTLTSDDEAGGHAAVISEGAWERLFNRDPAIAGRTVTLDGAAIAIVGVVKTIDGLGPGATSIRCSDPASPEFRDPRAAIIGNVVARLRPEVSRVAAQAEMQPIAADVARAYPDGRAGHTIEIGTLDAYYSATYNAPKLFFFLGASLVVLLLSCANVANLLVTRALTRRREFAIRGALGGGSVALARQLIVEGGVLGATPRELLGILLTAWSLALLRRGCRWTISSTATTFRSTRASARFALALTA